jgi:hypothetical protein
MPQELMIHLRYNLKTGKKDILVDFVSEEDALPIEHEKQHREIMARLLGAGVLRPEEAGDLVVRRLTPQEMAANQQTPPQDHQEAQKH